MKPTCQAMLFGAALAVLVGWVARAEAFCPGFAEDWCLDISQASDDVVATLQSFDFTGFGEKQCKAVCKQAEKACKELVKQRGDCAKNGNKLEEQAGRADCKASFAADKQGKKACQRALKDAKKTCDGTVQDAKQAENRDCRELRETTCRSICGA